MIGSFDFSKDLVCFSRPFKTLRIGIVFIDVIPYFCYKFLDVSERAATNLFISNIAKLTFDYIQPGTAGWDKVQMNARMFFYPDHNRGFFMRCIIVEDYMKVKRLVCFTIELFQKTQPFLMGMLLFASRVYFSVNYVYCRKQGRCPVTLIIMRHRTAAPWNNLEGANIDPQRQPASL